MEAEGVSKRVEGANVLVPGLPLGRGVVAVVVVVVLVVGRVVLDAVEVWLSPA